MGGTLAAIEGGFQQRQIQEAAYRVQRAIESGDQVVVGVNRFRDDEVHTPPLHRIDPDGERRQIERVRRVRAERSAEAWTAAMDRLEATARGDGNLMPPILEAVRAYATVGEISDRLRVAWGEHRELDHGLTPERDPPMAVPAALGGFDQDIEPGDPVRKGSAVSAWAAMSSNAASPDSVIVRCGMTSSNAPPYGGKSGNRATDRLGQRG